MDLNEREINLKELYHIADRYNIFDLTDKNLL